MNKVITAIDGLKYSHSSTEHAIFFARQMKAHLVGLMLDDYTYHSYKIYEVASDEGVSETELAMLEQKDNDIRKTSAEAFEKACSKSGLNYSIHHDRNIAFRELLHESIYADLLVIDQKENFMHHEEQVPTTFMRDLLAEVQCPVIVTPTFFRPIDKIILLYDGTPASVYAIRAFAHLFSFGDLPVEVITVKGMKESSHVPDNSLMKEFMKRHFPTAEYTVLKGVPASGQIVNYILDQECNALIVLGAYSRGYMSRFFRQSMADILMQDLSMPLFVAHR